MPSKGRTDFRAIKARRDKALSRPELRAEARSGIVSKPSSGATSAPIRDADPETRAMIDAALVRKGILP